MSMTWAQIRKAYLAAVGDTEAAREEGYQHLSEGYREVANVVDAPELNSLATITVDADTDFEPIASISPTPFAVLNVFNVTDGVDLHPEPEGMMGRDRYLEKTTAKPPSGPVTHYIRDGANLYVRNMPTANTSLRVRVRRQVPAITEADLASGVPVTPEQYDMAIVMKAARSYFLVHPNQSSFSPNGQLVDMAAQFETAAQQKLFTPKVAPAEEDRSRRETMRLRGYQIRSWR